MKGDEEPFVMYEGMESFDEIGFQEKEAQTSYVYEQESVEIPSLEKGEVKEQIKRMCVSEESILILTESNRLIRSSLKKKQEDIIDFQPESQNLAISLLKKVTLMEEKKVDIVIENIFMDPRGKILQIR